MLFNSLSTNRRLRELEDEITKLKRLVASRDLDWDEMRARCKRLLDRTEKQVQYQKQSESPATEEPQASPLTSVATSPDRLARIKQQLELQGRK